MQQLTFVFFYKIIYYETLGHAFPGSRMISFSLIPLCHPGVWSQKTVIFSYNGESINIKPHWTFTFPNSKNHHILCWNNEKTKVFTGAKTVRKYVLRSHDKIHYYYYDPSQHSVADVSILCLKTSSAYLKVPFEQLFPDIRLFLSLRNSQKEKVVCENCEIPSIK